MKDSNCVLQHVIMVEKVRGCSGRSAQRFGDLLDLGRIKRIFL